MLLTVATKRSSSSANWYAEVSPEERDWGVSREKHIGGRLKRFGVHHTGNAIRSPTDEPSEGCMGVAERISSCTLIQRRTPSNAPALAPIQVISDTGRRVGPSTTIHASASESMASVIVLSSSRRTN